MIVNRYSLPVVYAFYYLCSSLIYSSCNLMYLPQSALSRSWIANVLTLGASAASLTSSIHRYCPHQVLLGCQCLELNLK